MGSEASRLIDAEIEPKPDQVTDFWTHHRASLQDTVVSVLKNEAGAATPPWATKPPLEIYANNLKKYRHPSIVRYVCHWLNRNVYYLATEPAQPLARSLPSLDSIQICVGLHQIVRALGFLHENALQSHNNVSISSIYVTPDGCWKLGGMEFLRPFTEMTLSYLKQTKKYRYDDAVDPNEEICEDLKKIDQYAFCTLLEDVFRGKNDDDIPQLKTFKSYCKKELQNRASNYRPSFSIILQHEFFNHEFLMIYKFLTSLPVQTEQDKNVFFSNLLENLKKFNEETVAKQLCCHLLSRLVLLNQSAREKFLPYVLTPKENNTSTPNQGLFSSSIFKQYVTPQLLRMFQVRDIQVRLLLLKHFTSFMNAFSQQDLIKHVLPELLLGIKDKDDNLVSMTLMCLAELVPILGASTVIGGKRTKLFTDGRPTVQSKIDTISLSKKFKDVKAESNIKNGVPQLISNPNSFTHCTESETSSRRMNQNDNSLMYQNSFESRDSLEIENNQFFLERPSPDGGEDLDNEIHKNNLINNIDDSDGNWSDWGDTDVREVNALNLDNADSYSNVDNNVQCFSETDDTKDIQQNQIQAVITEPNKHMQNDPSFLQKAALNAKSKKLTDITELDIKNQKYSSAYSLKTRKDEFDFFTDMEPVIQKASTFTVDREVLNNAQDEFQNNPNISSKLSFAPNLADQIEMINNAWDDVNIDDD